MPNRARPYPAPRAPLFEPREERYDKGLCMLALRSDCLFIQQNCNRGDTELDGILDKSGAASPICDWSLRGTPTDPFGDPQRPADCIPPGAQEYTCDNRYHENEVQGEPYLCACGAHLSNSTSCPGRCDSPMSAAFSTSCNLVMLPSPGKGNFTGDAAQGACLSAAGSRQLPSGGQTIFDGIGLEYRCDNRAFDFSFKIPTRALCSCDGALDLAQLGLNDKSGVNANACGLAERQRQPLAAGRIGAGGIVGIVLGTVSLLALCAAIATVAHRRRKGQRGERRHVESATTAFARIWARTRMHGRGRENIELATTSINSSASGTESSATASTSNSAETALSLASSPSDRQLVSSLDSATSSANTSVEALDAQQERQTSRVLEEHVEPSSK